ncbi:hypothetical protein T484DRAFT_1939976 [Baffinella frigidus]|nr:hypothetical protein T484DRAFT_1939976 [Cryptophyta sp. CCMP2293]|eukprot:CAMPEP_0180150560 /NCGR_PEP_ID=MMETSP0986-20121125/21539_1 /TAXON_ID=697907 /ORGANISM="non described non described, Strain CCMP2293" /LENGTH=63 /DNA_ID=CAMNT_0022097553 /DNA_START=345 /DNA_END=536 /DNA_ORIENTATION=-
MFTRALKMASGASPVTEAQYKMFKQAMGEQGLSKSSDQDVMADGKKKALDAWGASGGMPRIKQ